MLVQSELRDSKVSKTLTEMPRKGDAFHEKGPRRPSPGVEGRKASRRR